MRFATVSAAIALAGSLVSAQRPTNTSICDYYTTALLKNNTAANQYTLLNLLVNTVVIGNYTQPNVGVKVPGILANGTFNGTSVSLLPYFTGALNTTNRGGASGVSVNFLDGGGAAPLMMNMPANNTSSNQYMLLTHLYQFFGSALGCSGYGMTGFNAYQGVASQYTVHKFMRLNYAQTGYFIQQVGLAAQSFGVAQSDISAVAMQLDNIFNHRCTPPTAVIQSAGPVLQSICIVDSCPLAANASCAAYNSTSTSNSTRRSINL